MASTQLFELVTNYIPLRIKVLERTIRLYDNVKQYFASDLANFNEQLGDSYWQDNMNILAPEFEGQVMVTSKQMLEKENFSKYNAGRRKRLAHALYLQAKHNAYDNESAVP